MSLSYKAMLICLLGCVALPAIPVRADAPAAAKSAAAKTDARTQEQTEQKRKTLMTEATAALAETQSALTLLDAGKKQEALAALERATGKLDIILARDPSLTLAPAASPSSPPICRAVLKSPSSCVSRRRI